MSTQQYRALVERADALSKPLFERYRDKLQCRKGCYFCCTDISVLPVEHHHLAGYLDANPEIRGLLQAQEPIPGPKRCPLLKSDGSCSVYPARPIICRVHGLPLAYRLYEYDLEGNLVPESDRMDSWCDLNFTDLEDPPRFFDRQGRIDMVELHGMLEEVDREFCATSEATGYVAGEYYSFEELLLSTTLRQADT